MQCFKVSSLCLASFVVVILKTISEYIIEKVMHLLLEVGKFLMSF